MTNDEKLLQVCWSLKKNLNIWHALMYDSWLGLDTG